MAESVVTFFLDKLSELIEFEANLILGVDKEIRSLQSQLQWIRSFLKDADAKSMDNERVRIWVSQISDVAYDAEDIIDAFILQREHQRQKDSSSMRFLRRFTRPMSHHHFGQKIQDVNKTIEEISANKSKYGIESIQGGEASTSSIKACSSKQKRTSFMVEESDVVGIKEDVEALVRRLVKGGTRRTVISIVGMGGLGKTTLAKKVYNNNEVKKHFNCHAWVSISQEYSIRVLLQGVLRSIMVLHKEEMELIEQMDVENLRKTLAEYLKEKIYLIVLDDIWSMEVWDAFQPTFPDGMKGSRVIITTRNKDVAMYADARSAPYELKFLPESKCWELFCKKAFPNNVRACCPPELFRLGKDIVAKCGGLPLAILVLGGTLSRKKQVQSEWEKVYKSAHWQLRDGQDRISGILALSYNDLPYYLKSCFLYCGVFPENAVIPTRKLIILWIAEGFVQQRGEETMEEVAEDYLEELICRSMIQVATRSSNGQVKTCHIHDLLRDLAIHEAKEGKFFNIYANNDSITPTLARRLVVYHENTTQNLSSRHLRSFLRFTKDADLEKSYCKSFFGGLKLVRVLDLEGVRLSLIPKEIGKLIHLRYLGLRKTGITTLPPSICNLSNLQTLDIRETGCRSLPKGFWKNRFLRQLHMGTCVFQVPKLINENPITLSKHVKLGHLESLVTLTGITAGSWIENSLEKLTNLHKLGIGRVSSVHGMGLRSSLEKLNVLYSLWIEGDSIPTLKLSRHQNLYKMYLLGGMERLPSLSELPANLTKLLLKGSKLKQDPFPVLMELQKLRFLGLIQGAYSGKEMHCFEGGFSQLKVLVIQLSELEDWEVDVGALPRLRSLSLIECARLKTLPEGMAYMTKLRDLKLFGMPSSISHNVCEYGGGSEWYKIEHIPSVTIKEYGDDYNDK